jgi:hypothetical protein
VSVSTSITGSALNISGYLLKWVPIAGFLIDRIPNISNKETQINYIPGKEEIVRNNIFPIIGSTIHQTASAIYLKSNASLLRKNLEHLKKMKGLCKI